MDKDNKDTRSDDEIIATKFVRRSDKNVSMKATSDLQERRLQAQMARRKVFVSSEKFSSIFDSMTQEEKNAFFDKERRRAKGVLRRRTIGRNIWTGVGVVIASIAAIIAILPLFFTFLNSFMTSAEINDNYGMVFQSLSGHSVSAAKYLSSTPVLKLIPEQVTIEQDKTLMFMSPTYLLKFWNSSIDRKS